MARNAKYKNNEELVRRAKDGDTSAEEELLLANDKLCFHIARKFNNTNIGLEDCASLARIGLYKAYKSFDLDRGIKFATYATRLMTNEILMEVRRQKKHKDNVSLDMSLNTDVDGNELTLIDVIPAPESNISSDDLNTMNQVVETFCENAKESDIAILNRCIINDENQRDVAKDLGISQSYVSRLVKSIEKRLKYIAENGKYINVSANNRKEDAKVVKEGNSRRYKKEDYVYMFRNYPYLKNTEIALIMGLGRQIVVNYKCKFNKGQYDDLDISSVSKELVKAAEQYALNHENAPKEISTDFVQEEVIYKPVPKKIIEITNTMPENKVDVVADTTKKIAKEKLNDIDTFIESLEKEPDRVRLGKMITEREDSYKKEKVSKKENIILNNQISIMSNKEEVSKLIHGIYQLLKNSPEDTNVKLDLKFEVSK